MTRNATHAAATAPLTLTIRRRFAATPERLYRYWTENPARPEDFWGPAGFTLIGRRTELVEGGHWLLEMRAPDGGRWRSGGVWRELAPPHRLAMTHAWLDDDDRPRGPETLVTVELMACDGGCEMLFTQTGFASTADRDGHDGGWSEAFDALGRAVAA